MWHDKCRGCECKVVPRERGLLSRLREVRRRKQRLHMQEVSREVVQGQESVAPHFGFTKLDLPVHAAISDYHKTGSLYGKFNKKVALGITRYVGTMTCFWLFCLLALCSLPAVLSGFGAFAHTFPAWMIKTSDIALVAWVAQTFIQLVLLPALMVGQNLQNVAADARSAKTFEDIEILVDRTDLHTQGGLTAIEEHLAAQDAILARLTGHSS